MSHIRDQNQPSHILVRAYISPPRSLEHIALREIIGQDGRPKMESVLSALLQGERKVFYFFKRNIKKERMFEALIFLRTTVNTI